MSRDDFRRQCAAVPHASYRTQLRHVLTILGVYPGIASRLAADLDRRGFTPGYLAAWALDRL